MCARIGVAGLVVALIAVSCSTEPVYTDRDISDVMLTWVNTTGLIQQDPDVWAERLDRICEIDTASDEASVELTNLANTFIQEDAELSTRADGRLPEPAEAAEVLWISARSPTCRK